MAEEKAVQENPTLDEKVEVPEETKSAEDIQDLLNVLKAANVSKPSQLEGQLANARMHGEMANTIGELRQQVKALEEARNQKPTYDQDYSQDDYGAGTIDIKGLVGSAVRDALADEKKQQMEANQRASQTWNHIRNDDHYELVKPVWEEKLKDPNFTFMLQSGQVDPVQEYNKTVISYFKTLVKTSHDTISTLQKGSGVTPPHVEGSEKIAELPKEKSKKEDEFKSLKEKTDKGYIPSDDEVIGALAEKLRLG